MSILVRIMRGAVQIIDMGRFHTFSITESGLHFTLRYTKKSMEEAFLPLTRRILEEFHTNGDRPYILCIAGPPGCGKSSIAHLLKILFERQGIDAQVLPMDGFHLKNSVLKEKTISIDGEEFPLYRIKGAKETYDTKKLFDSLKKLSRGDSFYWPAYSRTTHDPVNHGVRIGGGRCIYIVEGNYLLLSETPWTELQQYFNKRVFTSSRERILRPRVIGRKRMGGISRSEARRHYLKSDRRNIREVLAHSGGYDWLLVQRSRYRYDLRLK